MAQDGVVFHAAGRRSRPVRLRHNGIVRYEIGFYHRSGSRVYRRGRSERRVGNVGQQRETESIEDDIDRTSDVNYGEECRSDDTEKKEQKDTSDDPVTEITDAW